MADFHTKKIESYAALHDAFKGVLAGPITWESALVSLIALLKETFPAISWVGFYRESQGHLWVGPYQGKLACIRLKPGQGVCGTSLAKAATLIVEDVHAFEGHVACDPAARSEIVVPVFRTGGRTSGKIRNIVGVLDLDSHQASAFDATDQNRLEELLGLIEPLPDALSQ